MPAGNSNFARASIREMIVSYFGGVLVSDLFREAGRAIPQQAEAAGIHPPRP